jgi:hypothetical protein
MEVGTGVEYVDQSDGYRIITNYQYLGVHDL